jgi:uncharacterized membrane protein
MKRRGKLVAGVIAGAGAAYLLDPDRGASRRSDLLRAARSVVGLDLLTRMRGIPGPARLVRLGTAEQGIKVEKTLTVAAPVARTWELWSNFDRLPQFMPHLREVRKVDEGRSHWVAVGSEGVPVEWDAVITDWVPSQFIGWISVEGSPLEMSGQVRFRPISDGETEVDVQLAYSPPAGVAGHMLASILGADARRTVDEDLVRFKSLAEQENETVRSVKPGRARRKSPSSRRKH